MMRYADLTIDVRTQADPAAETAAGAFAENVRLYVAPPPDSHPEAAASLNNKQERDIAAHWSLQWLPHAFGESIVIAPPTTLSNVPSLSPSLISLLNGLVGVGRSDTKIAVDAALPDAMLPTLARVELCSTSMPLHGEDSALRPPPDVICTSSSTARGMRAAAAHSGWHLRQSLLLNFALPGWRRWSARLLSWLMRPRLGFLASAALPTMPQVVVDEQGESARLRIYAPFVAESHLLLPSLEVGYDAMRYGGIGGDASSPVSEANE